MPLIFTKKKQNRNFNSKQIVEEETSKKTCYDFYRLENRSNVWMLLSPHIQHLYTVHAYLNATS